MTRKDTAMSVFVVLLELLTILQYACDIHSEDIEVRDAAVEASIGNNNIVSGKAGVESSNPASNAGSPSGGAAGRGESHVTGDAAPDGQTSDNGDARGVADGGETLQSEDGSAPNSSECPTTEPQLGYACDIDSQIVCRYDADLCVCQELEWLCFASSTPNAIDASVAFDGQITHDAEDGEGEEGEGPKWGSRADGGTRGHREGGQPGSSHDASEEH